MNNGTHNNIRKKLRRFFNGKLFHAILALLIGIDLIIVLLDIIFALIYCNDIPHDIEEAIEILGIFSIIILGVFLIELFAQIYAFGWNEWRKETLHIFDLSIVLITFILEIVFHGNESVESMVGLLIVFRLWRIVRVIHVTTEVLEYHDEQEDKEYEDKIKELSQENERLKKELKELRSNTNNDDINEAGNEDEE